MALTRYKEKPIIPSESEALLVRQSCEIINSYTNPEINLQLSISSQEEGNQRTIKLSPFTTKLLIDVLNSVANGESFTMIPINAEMTTQEAADFLKVSRPFLVELLEKGEIPHKKVGTHRRIKFQDVLEYSEKSYNRKMKALDELTKISQEMNLY